MAGDKGDCYCISSTWKTLVGFARCWILCSGRVHGSGILLEDREVPSFDF